jgi:hypothetical protein
VVQHLHRVLACLRHRGVVPEEQPAGDQANDQGFVYELGQDVPAAGAEGLADADLLGSFGKGHQHDER